MNVRVAVEAYNKIVEDPNKWDQSAWHCGTACCFAGHIGLVTGWRFEFEDADDPENCHPFMYKEIEGKIIRKHAEKVGLEELGFWYDYPHQIFNADNSLYDIKNLIEFHGKVELLEEEKSSSIDHDVLKIIGWIEIETGKSIFL